MDEWRRRNQVVSWEPRPTGGPEDVEFERVPSFQDISRLARSNSDADLAASRGELPPTIDEDGEAPSPLRRRAT